MKSLYEHIGNKIKILRTDKSISAKAFGKHIGMSRSSIINLEAGRHRVSLKNLYMISSALDVKVHNLLPDKWKSFNVAPMLNVKKIVKLKAEIARLNKTLQRLELNSTVD